MKAYHLFLFLLTGLFISCQGGKPDTSKQFSLLPASYTGVDFVNEVVDIKGSNFLLYEYYYNGAGVGVGDINNDGLPDLFFAGNQAPNRLYLNKGKLKFEDITESSGILNDGGWSTGVNMADVNNDGWLDIYVARAGTPYTYQPNQRGNLLYINNGDNTFTEKAAAMGVSDKGYATHSLFFDYDKDGDLDLYVLNHPVKWRAKTSYTYEEKIREYDEFITDHLYRNNGNGSFTDVSANAGILAAAFGLSVNVTDINEDGWPDLYIANDYWIPDFMYVNNGNGTFTNKSKEYFPHMSLFSMGSDVQDINNDGLLDIITVDMMPEDNYRFKTHEPPANYDKLMLHVEKGYHYQFKRNALQMNNGNGSFSDIGQLAGVGYTDWSWSALLTDFDNDGYKDLYVTNGFRRDYSDWDFMQYTLPEYINQQGGMSNVDGLNVLALIPEKKLPNYMFRNKGDLTFENETNNWGFETPSYSNGAAYADLDLDGDLDLVVNNINDPAFIYQNNTVGKPGTNYIRFKLKSEAADNGIGSGIKITTSQGIQYQKFAPVRGFMSTVEPFVHFGIGKDSVVNSVEIVWPDGRKQNLEKLNANQVVILDQSAATERWSPQSQPEPIFKDITAESGLDYRHAENDYVDFKQNPLLPHLYSRNGPALATGDLDGDGKDDIYVGGAKHFVSKNFLQRDGNIFEGHIPPEFNSARGKEDVDALFLDADGDGDLDLYVVCGTGESDEGSDDYQDCFFENTGNGKLKLNQKAIPALKTGGACLAAVDFDNDGDMDIAVGGGLLPNHYPTGAPVHILRNDKGVFKDVTSEIAPELLKPDGIVKDLLWADVNGDGSQDLLVAGEWMAINIYINEGGKLVNKTKEAGLSDQTGWWNCLATADFDGDGDQDIIAGNLGLNARLKASPSEPVKVYAKDFDGNGSMDAILTSFIQGKSYPLHTRDEIFDQLPMLKSKFLRYKDYAEAGINEIFTPDQLSGALTRQVITFATSYLENDGKGHFILRPMPGIVQIAPVNDILTGDFNGDGKTDLLMIGNNYDVDAEIGNYDGSPGWYLQGDGTGSFTSVPPTQSGFYVKGHSKKIRAIQSGDKTLIIIGKNSGPMQVFEMKRKMVDG